MSNMLLEAKEIHTYYGASHILHRNGSSIVLWNGITNS